MCEDVGRASVIVISDALDLSNCSDVNVANASFLSAETSKFMGLAIRSNCLAPKHLYMQFTFKVIVTQLARLRDSAILLCKRVAKYFVDALRFNTLTYGNLLQHVLRPS